MAELKRNMPLNSPAEAGSPVLSAQSTAAERTQEALAAMGEGEVAYMRAFRASELRHIFPQSADMHPSVQLFALFGADGTPLMLADSREAILAGAWQNDLAMAKVH
ncbi:MAG: DUF1150 domain-containing protein [Proteobacteria bacterium]|nr:DUF1150 domain-containing protein [Pseudomonadota bacterium]